MNLDQFKKHVEIALPAYLAGFFSEEQEKLKDLDVYIKRVSEGKDFFRIDVGYTTEYKTTYFDVEGNGTTTVPETEATKVEVSTYSVDKGITDKVTISNFDKLLMDVIAIELEEVEIEFI